MHSQRGGGHHVGLMFLIAGLGVALAIAIPEFTDASSAGLGGWSALLRSFLVGLVAFVLGIVGLALLILLFSKFDSDEPRSAAAGFLVQLLFLAGLGLLGAAVGAVVVFLRKALLG